MTPPDPTPATGETTFAWLVERHGGNAPLYLARADRPAGCPEWTYDALSGLQLSREHAEMYARVRSRELGVPCKAVEHGFTPAPAPAPSEDVVLGHVVIDTGRESVHFEASPPSEEKRVELRQVKSWSQSTFSAYSDKHCCVCASPVCAPTWLMVHRDGSGRWWVISPGSRASAEEDALYHGPLPIGSDCLRKHPEYSFGLIATPPRAGATTRRTEEWVVQVEWNRDGDWLESGGNDAGQTLHRATDFRQWYEGQPTAAPRRTRIVHRVTTVTETVIDP